MTNKKPSSSSLPERSLLKENKKRKVPPAKVNKGVKKHARVEAEDAVSEEDDIEVDSEDEFAVVRVLYCMSLTSCTCNDLIVSGLVCWPGEAGHCLHQLRVVLMLF